MSAPDGPLVVIGVGNLLLGDDGVGVRVIQHLRRLSGVDPDAMPPGTRLVDGGTLGLGLVRYLHGARALLIVDAADRGAPAGSIRVRRDRRLTGPGGVADLLAVADLLGVLPPAVAIVEVGVGEVEAGTALSPCVDGALPVAVAIVLDELRALRRPTGVSA